MLTCEIITTGTELLLGMVVNTHPNHIAPKLMELGIRVVRITTVGDDRVMMKGAVNEALKHADLIVITGGLGPTSDDFTRDVVAELLGRKLHPDAKLLELLQERFRARNRPMPAGFEIQAQVPEGGLVLPNDFGTAPGLALGIEDSENPRLILMLPGPPRELHPMFDNYAVSLLREWGGADPIECRVLRTVGMGESLVAEIVEPIIQGRPEIEVGYCARPNEVDVRLIAHGTQAKALADELEALIRSKIGGIVFGCEKDRLEEVVVRELIRQKRTLATAESCTGGLLAHRVTNISGSSEVFLEGVICYSNEAKVRDVGVKPETLKAHGAVSEPVARELAEGIRRRAGTDFGIGITGIAGPTGGTPEKPVGLVYIGLATPLGGDAWHFNYKYDRETFKLVVTQTALDMLRQALKGLER